MDVNQASTTATFEALRGRLFGLAYRMLGSRAEAEDIVQEAYLRWHQAERGASRTPRRGWSPPTSRLAIDRLRRLQDRTRGLRRAVAAGADRQRRPRPIAISTWPKTCRWRSSRCSNGSRRRSAPPSCCTTSSRSATGDRVGARAQRERPAARSCIARASGCAAIASASTRPKRPSPTLLRESSCQAMEARDERALLSSSRRTRPGPRTAAARPPPRRGPIVGAERIARLVIGLREKFWAVDRTDRGRDGQRRDRAVHPRRRAPDGDAVDRHRRRTYPGRLRGRQPRQAALIRLSHSRGPCVFDW